MPEMEPLEGEPFNSEDPSARESNEQSARSFFAMLSFLIAFIFLITFVNNPPSSISGLFVLFGIFIFGLGGVYLLSSANANRRKASLSFSRDQPDKSANWGDATGTTIVDSTLADVENEDEQEAGDLSAFEKLVEAALASIPFEFQEQMANLAVLVESEPDEEVLERVGVHEGETLLGLYQGVPLTSYGQRHAILPQRITIYQRNIEAYCHGDPALIQEQVRSTVLHEVAHHFGMDHEEMPIWVR
jgi:predicted Zn-dependent protease with MMP-like domain